MLHALALKSVNSTIGNCIYAHLIALEQKNKERVSTKVCVLKDNCDAIKMHYNLQRDHI